MTTVEIYESPKKEENVEKFGYRSDMCECCGKTLKGQKYRIKATESYEAVPVEATEEEVREATGEELLGTFLVGSSCAKKFPKGYVEKIS